MGGSSTTTEMKYCSSVGTVLFSADWLQHNLKPFQRAFKYTFQHTSTQSLNRNIFHERVSKASKQSILFNNNLGSLTVYPLTTLVL